MLKRFIVGLFALIFILNQTKAMDKIEINPTNIESNLYVKHWDGLEKYLIQEIQTSYNENKHVFVTFYINKTTRNFLKDAYLNPTTKKCNIIKSYLEGTMIENYTCTQIYNYISNRIQDGWRIYKSGQQMLNVSIEGDYILIDYGKVTDEDTLQLGDYSLIIIQNTTFYANSILNNVTIEPSNISHLDIDRTKEPFDSLCAYFSFDSDSPYSPVTANTTTGRAYDWSINQHDATISNTTLNNSGCPIGNCFTSRNSYYDWGDIGANKLIMNQTNFSLSFYLQPFDKKNYYSIVYFTVGGSNFPYLIWGSTGAMYYSYENKTGTMRNLQTIGTTNTVESGKWKHYIVTYNLSSPTNLNVSLYINGVLNRSVTTTEGMLPQIFRYIAFRGGTNLSGSIDELMYFNKTLSITEASDIYNNLSSRFVSGGSLSINGTINITMGTNRLNVSLTDFTDFNGSSVNLFFGFLNNSWFNTASQRIVSTNTNYTYTISDKSINITYNFTMTPSTNRFYSPLLEGQIVIDGYNVAEGEGPASTCAYVQGNWNVNCIENCTITDNYDVGGNNITFFGRGTINLFSNITNYKNVVIGDYCYGTTHTGGGFR